MRFACWRTWNYRHTLRICNNYCFSTATMFKPTRLKVKVILVLPFLCNLKFVWFSSSVSALNLPQSLQKFKSLLPYIKPHCINVVTGLPFNVAFINLFCCNQNFKSFYFNLYWRRHNSLGDGLCFLGLNPLVRDARKRLNQLLTQLTITLNLLPLTFPNFPSSFISSPR